VIARRRRLERVRSRQRDEARAGAIRAEGAARLAVRDQDEAEQAYFTTAIAGATASELEQAMAAVAGSIQAVNAAQERCTAAQGRIEAASRAWQRADVALAQAKALREVQARRHEAREHDEHAARRKR
jgi:hypothetical protein